MKYRASLAPAIIFLTVCLVGLKYEIQGVTLAIFLLSDEVVAQSCQILFVLLSSFSV